MSKFIKCAAQDAMLEVVQLRRTALPIGGTTYGFIVDFDHGLNAAVRNLRSVLGDSIESPGYIATIPRLG